MPSFIVTTHGKESISDITAEVQRLVAESGVAEGLCNVYTAHATAAITINENADPNILEDILDALGKIIKDGAWRHDHIDGNGAAHIKTSIIGPSESIPISGGRLCLGRWQNIFLCDFDGPRRRTVLVTILAQQQARPGA